MIEFKYAYYRLAVDGPFGTATEVSNTFDSYIFIVT